MAKVNPLGLGVGVPQTYTEPTATRHDLNPDVMVDLVTPPKSTKPAKPAKVAKQAKSRASKKK